MINNTPDYIKDGFDIDGNHYTIITPTCLEELTIAMRVDDALEIEANKHEPDDGNPYFFLKRVQKERINEYLSSLGEFDNTLMVKNISLLTKKRGIGIGDFERILGISPGYISRTAKENSGKKLSIDIVWKIARILGVSLRSLLETDLSYPNHNIDLASKFIEKVCHQTESDTISWSNYGGDKNSLNPKLASIPYFGKDIIYGYINYVVDHLNLIQGYMVKRDIYACNLISDSAEFLIVPWGYNDLEDPQVSNYDFYFLRQNPHRSDYYVELAFSTHGDKSGELRHLADSLYEQIELRQMDINLSAEMKDYINKYLN